MVSAALLASILLVVGPSLLSAAGATGPDGRLIVKAKHVNRGPVYYEGSVPFLKIRPVDEGEWLIDRRGDIETHRLLAAGHYELVSYVRPCAGSCDYLDRPRDRRRAELRIPSDQRLKVTITIVDTEPCRIRTDGPSPLEPPRANASSRLSSAGQV